MQDGTRDVNGEPLDEALADVARGWATLPLQPRSKQPATDLIHKTRGRRGWKQLGDRPRRG
jgi:hypothetical protein